MKIINVSQANDTEDWLSERIGRITGTKANGLCLDHYAQIDIDHLYQMQMKALEQSTKAKTEEKKNEYLAKVQDYERKIAEAHLSNMRRKTTADFWRFLAERWAEPASDEPPMDRGHRLEPVNIEKTLERLGIEPDECVTDTGMWLSDSNDDIACSPDAYECDNPVTWAIECKSLSSAKHLQYVVPYILHNKMLDGFYDERSEIVAKELMPEYVTDPTVTDFVFIPPEYKRQVLQYFIVDEDLDQLYFSMYDDRFYEIDPDFGDSQGNTIRHTIIMVNRDQITDEINEQKEMEEYTLNAVNILTKEMRLW